MRTRDVKIAEQFGIIVRCKAFESDLLEIKDIVPDKMDGGIGFDLTGFLSDIYQVIIIPQVRHPRRQGRLLGSAATVA